ncbi:MAG: cache domain-containing protein, partial [Coleofasciculus sp. Co-bin14]|nr:cache domain-containing protein [Coleofasciculus sp. Co-bin14]
MGTQFDPEIKPYNAYSQELNGQGKGYPNGVNRTGLINYSNGQRHLEPALPEPVVNSVEFPLQNGTTTQQNFRNPNSSGWQRLRLTQKVTAFAIALGTIPVLLTGITAYQFANQGFVEQVTKTKIQHAVGIEDKVKRFMRERYGDVQLLAQHPLLATANLRDATPVSQKQALLDRYVDTYKIYDSVAVFDLKGNVVVQSKGDPLTNHSDREWFKEVLSTNQPVISKAVIPKVPGQSQRLTLAFAAPIKDSATGQTIAIIRTRMPVDALEELIKNFGTDGDEYYLVESTTGKIFLAKEKNKEDKNAQEAFRGLAQLQAAEKLGTKIVQDPTEKGDELLAYAPFGKLDGLPDLKWGAMIATPTDIAFAPQRQILLALTLGTGLTVLLVSAIAAYLAKRAVRPV